MVLIALSAFYFLPFYVMILTGLKPYEDVSVWQMWDLPKEFYMGSIIEAWNKVSRNFLNSALVTIPAAIISTLIGSINGYIFAKWPFRGSNLIFFLFLFGLFLPYQAILIPLVQVLVYMGIYAKIVGLIVVHCIFGIPLPALLFRSYFVGIPKELIDAAKIDGCGFFGIYLRILLPISLPAFAVVLLWQFTFIWNDYLLGLVVLSNPVWAPINVAVRNLTSMHSIPWNTQMSASLIASLPCILVYLLLGKLFMRGLLSGSLKG